MNWKPTGEVPQTLMDGGDPSVFPSHNSFAARVFVFAL